MRSLVLVARSISSQSRPSQATSSLFVRGLLGLLSVTSSGAEAEFPI
jgi:hypothetical protein